MAINAAPWQRHGTQAQVETELPEDVGCSLGPLISTRSISTQEDKVPE